LAFPHTYKNKTELLENHFKGEKLNIDLLYELLLKEIKLNKIQVHESDDKSLKFSLNSKLFKYKFDVKLRIVKKRSDFNVLFEIEMEKTLQIIIAGIILLAFFSFVSIKYFLIASALFSVLFYQLNLMINSNTVENLIKKAIGDNRYQFNSAEFISEEQHEWISDKNRCSGCGEYLDVTDVFCPDCGLRIKKGKPYVPYNISKHNDKKLNYHYKKKN